MIDISCTGWTAPRTLAFATASSVQASGEKQSMTLDRDSHDPFACTITAERDKTHYTGYWAGQFTSQGEPYFSDTACVPGQGRGHWVYPPTYTPPSTVLADQTDVTLPPNVETTVTVKHVAVCD
ncbi:MAG TPA: hypothetical protein VG889_06545 [Rhizomicrobium sp.]|nr:hypothetical protein [Rhizomicrobium sp.]